MEHQTNEKRMNKENEANGNKLLYLNHHSSITYPKANFEPLTRRQPLTPDFSLCALSFLTQRQPGALYWGLVPNPSRAHQRDLSWDSDSELTIYPFVPLSPNHDRTYVCVSGRKKCSFFRKTWRALFPCYLRFEIRLFALLQTIFSPKTSCKFLTFCLTFNPLIPGIH